MKTTFIYALCDPLTCAVRYIGKANNPRKRLKDHSCDCREYPKSEWVQLLRRSGRSPVMRIVDEVPSENWKHFERYYIQQAKDSGFDLLNARPGGAGSPCCHSEETRLKISQAGLGRLVKLETREKIRAAMTGRVRSPGHRASISRSHIGMKYPGSSSWMIGVFRSVRGCGFRWRSIIQIDGRNFHLGYYQSEVEAAQAYDYVAELYGRPTNGA